MPIRALTSVIVALSLLSPVGASCAMAEGCEPAADARCCCPPVDDGMSGCDDAAGEAVGSGCDCSSVADRQAATVPPRPSASDDSTTLGTAARFDHGHGFDPAVASGSSSATSCGVAPRGPNLLATCVLRL